MRESIPETMQASEISEAGGPEVLRLMTRPTPRPGADDVLIRVDAAGVNFPDILQRRGVYPPPPGAPDLLGLEVAGTIVAVGEQVASGAVGDDVPRWQVGDRVCALLAGGGYAEYCVAPAQQCLPIPAGLTAIEAASLPETYFTVWDNVFERGGLKPGETFLVHGGSSGIGTCAIQLAHAHGARVFATAGSPEKCVACEDLGAERAINYRTEDFVTDVKQATNDRGVNLILDMVGGDYVNRDLDALATHGRLVMIAFQKGPIAPLDVRVLLRKAITITGSLLRPRTPDEKGVVARAVQRHVWPWLEQKVVRPVIFATFPLSDAAGAHRLIESSTHIGKVVLTVSEGEGGR